MTDDLDKTAKAILEEIAKPRTYEETAAAFDTAQRDLDAYREAEAYGLQLKIRIGEIMQGQPVTRANLIRATMEATRPQIVSVVRNADDPSRLDVLVEYTELLKVTK